MIVHVHSSLFYDVVYCVTKKNVFKFMCIGVLSACMSVPRIYAWCLRRPKKDIRSSGTGVINSCESPCQRWELNLSLLEEQCVPLTIEPSLHPQMFIFKDFLGETVSHCELLLTWNLQRSVCFCPPSAGIEGLYYHALTDFLMDRK